MDADFLPFPAKFTWKGKIFDCMLQVRPHNNQAAEYDVIIGRKVVARLIFTRGEGWYFTSEKIRDGYIGSQLGHYVERNYNGLTSPYPRQ